MGGFVTRYKGDFDYLTIRGAGHMVGNTCATLLELTLSLTVALMSLLAFLLDEPALITIKVPEYKPAASLVFLGAWLKNEEYPRLDNYGLRFEVLRVCTGLGQGWKTSDAGKKKCNVHEALCNEIRHFTCLAHPCLS